MIFSLDSSVQDYDIKKKIDSIIKLLEKKLMIFNDQYSYKVG